MNVRLGLVVMASSILSCRQPEPAPVTEESAVVPEESASVSAPLDSQSVPAARGDSAMEVANGYPRVALGELERVFAPMRESVERVRTELRGNSATHVADSLFLARRGLLRETLRGLSVTLDDPSFQAATWPDGGAAQRFRRERLRAASPGARLTGSAMRATPPEVAHADSLVALLAAAGIQAMHGEGQVLYGLSEGFLLDQLGPYLTPEMQEFLRFLEREQTRPSADDASLMISLDELATRLLLAERFIQTYPASPVHEMVRSRYQRYLAIYLGGIDNTPAFDRRSEVMLPEWRSSLERFVANHGDTEAAQRTSEYLALLAASDFTRDAAVDAFLRNLWNTLRLVPIP